MKKFLLIIIASILIISIAACKKDKPKDADTSLEPQWTVASSLPVGSYIVDIDAHYQNPDTGESDDGGESSVGQSMVAMTTHNKGLWEVKEEGRVYLTIRMKLAAQIYNYKLYAQTEKSNPDKYEAVNYTITGENADNSTMDFRLRMPSEDTLVRVEFFVGAMGRTVTYYISFNVKSSDTNSSEFSNQNTPVSAETQTRVKNPKPE